MIYVVRHGQTDWNLIRRCQGHADIDLNSLGIEQAKEAKEKLKDIKFFKVFCSPLKRALQTAKIITNKEIIIDERLIERDNGLLEGQIKVNWEEIRREPNHESKYKLEPAKDMQKRVSDFLEEIIKKYPGKDILVVTHAGVYIHICNFYNHTNLESGSMKNGEIAKFDN